MEAKPKQSTACCPRCYPSSNFYTGKIKKYFLTVMALFPPCHSQRVQHNCAPPHTDSLGFRLIALQQMQEFLSVCRIFGQKHLLKLGQEKDLGKVERRVFPIEKLDEAFFLQRMEIVEKMVLFCPLSPCQAP